jgi:adenylate cyclase
MAFELFRRETETIEAAEKLLQEPKHTKKVVLEHFASLLADYKKLFKNSKRLVKMSDRNEAQLNATAKSLDEKSQVLGQLSDKLSKYLSPQVYESIFSGETDAEISTTRKKLTVFFSDIKDFTATTEGLQPEDLAFLINDYLTKMSEIALKHGATIDKYIGDAILIFFGDPTTKGVKEDALACVNMAIEMQKRMVDLRAKWHGLGYERPFHVRIGVNTGFVNVGNFGSAERMDYTIIGGEVNLAARLEGICDPDGIMIAAETYALVRDEVDAKEMPPINVKGIQREVKPFALQNVLTGRDEKNRFIRAEDEGMRLFLDLAQMDKKQRTKAAKQLEKAAAKLRDRKS